MRTYLASPPPPEWRALGNEYAEEAQKRGGSNPRAALQEWFFLMDTLVSFGARIVVVPRAPAEASDACYAADWGACIPGKGFVLSNMAAPHRRGETAYVREFLAKQLKLPIYGQMHSLWEGSSCYRISPGGTTAFVGYGVRAACESCDEIAELLGIKVLPLKTQEPHIHIDTFIGCASMRQKTVFACRSAFAEGDGNGWDPYAAWDSLAAVCECEKSRLMLVGQSDGVGYATNFRETGCGRIIAPTGLSEEFRRYLTDICGYRVHSIPLPCLFQDGGGAPACLTNDVTASVESGWQPPEKWLYENVREEVLGTLGTYPTHEMT